MFEALSDRLGKVLDRLKGRGALSEADVDEALREVRVALLEADVALPVVKDFVGAVRGKAVGQEVLRSVTPGQMVVKIVHDALVETLGGSADAGLTMPGQGTTLDLNAPAPVPVMMVGLQGSGKTTTTAKIAHRLQTRDKKRVLMASLDVARPAAQEQLKILGEQAGIQTLPIIPSQMPVDIAKRAMTAAKFGGFDVVMLDTAGRLHVDEALMAEIAAVKEIAKPHETLLVADSLTGQDAVTVAAQFNERLSLSGIVLTRTDGDGRGGAALSMRAVTGKPIKLIGTGEKLNELEEFTPQRIAGRILGMGDVVALVEKAAENIERDKAEAAARKMMKGEFDLNDLAEQFAQMRKMGGLQSLMGMLPGVAKLKQGMASSGLDDKELKRQEAIISSMTKKERAQPKLVDGKRKKRIAAGSGTRVEDVNRLLKMHRQMADMMKSMSKMGPKGLLRGGLGAMPGLGSLLGGGGGGMPSLPPGFPPGPLGRK